MSNQVYSGNLFNEDIKRRFLLHYPENNQGQYLRILHNAKTVEKDRAKDLYDFTSDEVLSFLSSLNPMTTASVRSAASIVRIYIDWAIRQGFTNTHPLDKLYGTDWQQRLININEKLYLSEEEIPGMEGMNSCVNAQDAVIFRLLFEGVCGKGYSELVNLRKRDVDFTSKTINLINEKRNRRQLQVSDGCLDLIKRALTEELYIKGNGGANLALNQREYLALVPSDYILRTSHTSAGLQKGVIPSTISRRTKHMAEFFGWPKVTPKNVHRSGMIYMAKNLLSERGKLDREEYELICERYCFNHWYLMKEFVNEKVIERVYGGSDTDA